MKKILRIFIAISLLYVATYAKQNQSTKTKNTEKCIDSSQRPKHNAELSYNNLCKYGKEGCAEVTKSNSIKVYCDSDKISSCFSDKEWLTLNQYVGISDKYEIINARTSITILNKKVSKQRCFEYKKKSKNLFENQEKFIQFKKMMPSLLHNLNKQLVRHIKCFEKEDSHNNMKSCLKQSNKTIEEMITKLFPSELDKLCKKDNGKYSFIWSKKNYDTTISKLLKKIQENQAQAKCTVKSNNWDELGKCLAKFKKTTK